MITCLTKQHDVKKLKQYKKIKSICKNITLSIGIKKDDFTDSKLLKNLILLNLFVLMFNGYKNSLVKL